MSEKMNYLDILHTLEVNNCKKIHEEYFDTIHKYTLEEKSTLLFLLTVFENENPMQALRKIFIAGFQLGIMFHEKLEEVRKLEEVVK